MGSVSHSKLWRGQAIGADPPKKKDKRKKQAHERECPSVWSRSDDKVVVDPPDQLVLREL